MRASLMGLWHALQMGMKFLTGHINLINMSLPVKMFEPRSYLEKLTDVWVYPELLQNAASATDPIERMRWAVTWSGPPPPCPPSHTCMHAYAQPLPNFHSAATDFPEGSWSFFPQLFCCMSKIVSSPGSLRLMQDPGAKERIMTHGTPW